MKMASQVSPVVDVQSMSNAVLKIISTTEELNRYKMNAKTQAQKFDIEHILQEYIDYYNEVYNEGVV